MNTTKLVLHFSDFSVIFYAIYKKQEINLTIEVHLLQQGPWKDFGFRNVVPGGAAGAAPVQFRRARRRTWSEKGWGRSYGLLGSGLGFWTGVERLRRAARRRPGRGGRGGGCSGEAAANAR
jgi:hypothetical protein